MKKRIITATEFIHRDIRSLISCDPMFFLRALLVQHRCNMMKDSLSNGKSEITEKIKNKNKLTSPRSSVFQVSFSGSLKDLLITFNSENISDR